MPIVLPSEYAYVGAGLLSTVWLLGWQVVVVGGHRKASGIKYPQLYAEKAEVQASKEALRFNCAQRAHQNTIEHMPLIIISTLITGVKYPLLAGAAAGFWSFSRVLYTLGYTTGDPAKRNTRGGLLGEVSVVGKSCLLLGATYTVYDLIQSI
ncbi:membrane-associated proteins in eicosanoid and glutathione metabolism [Leucogyrophana mollusca]|uniref:Membrane-associated proteins in eicosanoid and glutathione metabolism n=1 Tax=Leucogyrophana mollusca TaxID=85980 RepID=A0ACB8B3I0_9AGAM|nr:membrane-associated proteins in eicosanoid and glutathione metabolism [Leucogyrophana mollusca]